MTPHMVRDWIIQLLSGRHIKGTEVLQDPRGLSHHLQFSHSLARVPDSAKL